MQQANKVVVGGQRGRSGRALEEARREGDSNCGASRPSFVVDYPSRPHEKSPPPTICVPSFGWLELAADEE